MLHHYRLTRALLVGAFLLAATLAGASTASASRAIGTSGLTVTARGPVTFMVLGVNLPCTVELSLTLERSIVKAPGATALAVLPSPASSVTNCSLGASGTVNSGGTSTYTSFLGTLPAITGIRVATSRAVLTMTGGSLFPPTGCPYIVTAEQVFSGAAGTMTSFRLTGSFTTTTSGCVPRGTITNSALVLSLPIPMILA